MWRTAILFFLEWRAKKFEFVKLTKTMERPSWLDANFVSYVIPGSRLTQQLLLLRRLPKAIGFFICICSRRLFSEKITSLSYVFSEREALKHGIRNPESGNGNGNKRKRNTESNINDRKLKNFTLHNLVQSKENLS